MEIKKLMSLFKSWQNKQDNMGRYSSIELFSDGSGKILDTDDNMIFDFDTIEDLIDFLKGV